MRRWTTCATPGCKCYVDLPRRHGPYCDRTRRVGGKSAAKRVTPQQARVYVHWIRNPKRVTRTIAWVNGVAVRAARRLP